MDLFEKTITEEKYMKVTLLIDRDEDEFINVKEIPIKTVKEMIKSGEIIDGKTLAVFMLI